MFHNNQVPYGMANKIEIKITMSDSTETTWVCDQFDSIEVEKFMEPMYFPTGDQLYSPLPPEVSRYSFIVERPRGWTLYMPHLPGIDQGDIVEEG